mmetsp:Transcript_5538/g.17477  ORF Transcript_5538/g.17477 Transcript_5538/m.17477 type:complete len:123 (+) Transcript_5538:189-557(+)
MAGRKVAIFNCARSFNDDIYILQVFDNSPSGLLVKAYLQAKSVEYFMPITEGELDKAALSRAEKSLTRLADSISLVEKSGQTFLESSIPGIIKPGLVMICCLRSSRRLYQSFARRSQPALTQ